MDQFEKLAAGYGDQYTIELLIQGEYSRRLLLLRTLLDLVARRPTSLGPLPPVTVAWEALTTAEEGNAGAPALRTVLLHPQVGTWLARSLRLLRGSTVSGLPLWTEVGQIHAVAFAAAVRARVTLSTSLPIYAGQALLPTLGLARFPDGQGLNMVEAHTRQGTSMLRAGERTVVLPEDPRHDAPHWWGLRTITAEASGRRLSIWLDDIDRYRDLADPVGPDRLDEDRYAAWHRAIQAAWRILGEVDPEATLAMSAGLQSIVPIANDERYGHRTASTGDGFGGALIALPSDPTRLAVGLVHEFQHIKLGGLLHLATLHNDHGAESLYAPWRDDPRPLAGLLQGVYAFLGITRFWRRHAEVCHSDERSLSEFEFAYARRQTWTGLRTLLRSELLTGLGRSFVTGMERALRLMLSKPVSADARHAAWAAAMDHRACWRIRNLREDPARAEALAEAFVCAAVPPRTGAGEPAVIPDPDQWWRHPRIALLRLRMARPDRFAGPLRAFMEGQSWPSSTTAQDLMLVRGDHGHAAHGYEHRIVEDPDDYDAWSGLVLALAVGRKPGWHSLLSRPERTRAVFLALRARGLQPSPSAIAAWLDTTVVGAARSSAPPT